MIRLDSTGFDDLKIYQDDRLFCYGVDAVMIAAFAAGYINRRRVYSNACDLGTGNGIIPLILSHKTKLEKIVGVEINRDNIDLAETTAEENGLTGRLTFINANVADIGKNKSDGGASGLEPAYELGQGSFDAVVSNPPYIAEDGGIKCDYNAKTLARHEVTADLEDFLSAAAYLMKDRGELFMIHKAFRFSEIVEKAAGHRLELKDAQLISGKPEGEPELAMFRFIKGGNPGVHFLPQLNIRENDESFSKRLLVMYERE
ncbi:MAG: methyltransferase [Eubacteriales bacterium]|nr:methyltransferase [Eubacteriales bacterium]